MSALSSENAHRLQSPSAEPPADPSVDFGIPKKSLLSTRDRRLLWLLMAIAIVSAADLYMTLMYATTTGFAEGNPIARLIMKTGCTWMLGIWKVALVTFTILVLWLCRHRRSAELGAWIGVMVMAALCVQWWSYTKQIAYVMQENPEISQTSSWVTMGEAARE